MAAVRQTSRIFISYIFRDMPFGVAQGRQAEQDHLRIVTEQEST
jgi:hypothetical protein